MSQVHSIAGANLLLGVCRPEMLSLIGSGAIQHDEPPVLAN